MQRNIGQPLSTIEYTVVERFIENFSQQKKEHHYALTLTATAIYSNSRQFLRECLMDISYKPLSNGQGFLYLHTNEGVFTFIVSSNPTQFIRTYRQSYSN